MSGCNIYVSVYIYIRRRNVPKTNVSSGAALPLVPRFSMCVMGHACGYDAYEWVRHIHIFVYINCVYKCKLDMSHNLKHHPVRLCPYPPRFL